MTMLQNNIILTNIKETKIYKMDVPNRFFFIKVIQL